MVAHSESCRLLLNQKLYSTWVLSLLVDGVTTADVPESMGRHIILRMARWWSFIPFAHNSADYNSLVIFWMGWGRGCSQKEIQHSIVVRYLDLPSLEQNVSSCQTNVVMLFPRQ
jgi:hypothetical protein